MDAIHDRDVQNLFNVFFFVLHGLTSRRGRESVILEFLTENTRCLVLMKWLDVAYVLCAWKFDTKFLCGSCTITYVFETLKKYLFSNYWNKLLLNLWVYFFWVLFWKRIPFWQEIQWASVKQSNWEHRTLLAFVQETGSNWKSEKLPFDLPGGKIIKISSNSFSKLPLEVT